MVELDVRVRAAAVVRWVEEVVFFSILFSDVWCQGGGGGSPVCILERRELRIGGLLSPDTVAVASVPTATSSLHNVKAGGDGRCRSV